MATEVIKEINSYSHRYHFKIGIVFLIFFIMSFFTLKNTNYNDSIPFVATFNYIEGINIDSEVQLAGIKIGSIHNILLSSDGVTINGSIYRKYNIPEDSIIKIKSDGIFGRKALSIEPGFGQFMDKSKLKYIFNQSQDSYSVDMFLRYLSKLNE